MALIARFIFGLFLVALCNEFCNATSSEADSGEEPEEPMMKLFKRQAPVAQGSKSEEHGSGHHHGSGHRHHHGSGQVQWQGQGTQPQRVARQATPTSKSEEHGQYTEEQKAAWRATHSGHGSGHHHHHQSQDQQGGQPQQRAVRQAPATQGSHSQEHGQYTPEQIAAWKATHSGHGSGHRHHHGSGQGQGTQTQRVARQATESKSEEHGQYTPEQIAEWKATHSGSGHRHHHHSGNGQAQQRAVRQTQGQNWQGQQGTQGQNWQGQQGQQGQNWQGQQGQQGQGQHHGSGHHGSGHHGHHGSGHHSGNGNGEHRQHQNQGSQGSQGFQSSQNSQTSFQSSQNTQG